MESLDEIPGAETQPQHEGDMYLGLLGLEEYADRVMHMANGSAIQVRDFLNICGPHARPMLEGLRVMQESGNQEDFVQMSGALREQIMQRLGLTNEQPRKQ